MARESRRLLVKRPLPETPSTFPGLEEIMTQVLLWETAMILEEHEITFKSSLVLKRGTPQLKFADEQEQNQGSGTYLQGC